MTSQCKWPITDKRERTTFLFIFLFCKKKKALLTIQFLNQQWLT